MAVVIGVLRETAAGETRSALVPEVAKKLAALGATICAEHGVAEAARIPDSRFENVEFLGREEVVKRADVLLAVNPPPLEVAGGCARARSSSGSCSRIAPTNWSG